MFVWDHYTENKALRLVKCDHCGKEYKVSGATTNMKNYLANKQFIRVEKMPDQPLIDNAMSREIMSFMCC